MEASKVLQVRVTGSNPGSDAYLECVCYRVTPPLVSLALLEVERGALGTDLLCPSPSCEAGGTIGASHPSQPVCLCGFREPDPALLSALSFGLKLAHKFLGCLVLASK